MWLDSGGTLQPGDLVSQLSISPNTARRLIQQLPLLEELIVLRGIPRQGILNPKFLLYRT
jgi:hypothetical protein